MKRVALIGRTSTVLKLLAAMTLLALVCLGIVFFGVADRMLGSNGSPRATALQSVLLYWAIGASLIGVFAAWRSHRLQLLLVLISVGFSFAVVELAARIAEVPAGFLKWEGIPSRAQHHIYAPDRKMYAGSYEGSDVFVTTNGDGLRTPYSREEFLRFGTRVAMLGDSFTFGYGVAGEEALPAQLEAALRRELSTDDLAVLNAGIVSFSPLLEQLLFDNIVSLYEPTTVVMLIDPTDIGDDFKYTQEGVVEQGRTVFPHHGPECGESGRAHYYGAVVEILKPTLKHLETAFLVPWRRFGPSFGMTFGKTCGYSYYDFKISVGDSVETTRYFHYRYPLTETRRYFDATFAHVVATADAVRASGAEFLLVISPRYHHWNPAESPENWERGEYSEKDAYAYEYFRYFEEARDRVDFPIHGLLPAFEATDASPLVFRADPHWNPTGNAFVAGVLALHLTQAGLISSADSR